MTLAAAISLCSVLAPPLFSPLLVAIDFALLVQAVVPFGCSRIRCRLFDLLTFFSTPTATSNLRLGRLPGLVTSRFREQAP